MTGIVSVGIDGGAVSGGNVMTSPLLVIAPPGVRV